MSVYRKSNFKTYFCSWLQYANQLNHHACIQCTLIISPLFTPPPSVIALKFQCPNIQKACSLYVNFSLSIPAFPYLLPKYSLVQKATVITNQGYIVQQYTKCG